MTLEERINSCRRVRSANMDVVAELVEKIKGKRRSYNQLAIAMEVSPSSLTRIAKKEVSNVSKTLLIKLIEQMDPDCGVDPEELIRECGYEEPDQKPDRQRARKFEQSAGDIIRNELFRAGRMVMKGETYYERAQNELRYKNVAVAERGMLLELGFPRADFVIKTNTDDGAVFSWAFDAFWMDESDKVAADFMASIDDVPAAPDKDGAMGKMLERILYYPSKMETRSTIEMRRRIERANHMLSRRLQQIMVGFYCGQPYEKWSIVTNSTSCFVLFREMFREEAMRVRVRDLISMILVDDKEGCVKDEYIIPSEKESCFLFRPENE